MKVLYVADRHDPRDHNAGSGSDYQNYHVLVDAGLDVELVGPFQLEFSPLEKNWRRLVTRLTKKRFSKYPKSYLKKSSAQVENAIKKVDPDVIFSKSSAPLAYCPITKPLVYILDTSLVGQQQQWPVFSEAAYREMLAWEGRVIRESTEVLTYSKWSAEVIEHEYQVPAERISYFAIPSSIPEEVIPAEVAITERELIPLHLLLVGRTDKRKGIDIAMQVVEILNERGVSAELRIVGLSGETQGHTRFMGLYNKTVPEELAGYIENYQWAHFLIHPARFEAAGIVPGEAAAFGVPTLTNDVGGLATTVKDGVSGMVLPKDSPAEAYVETILQYVNDRESYLQLCRSTKQRYHDELNWSSAGKFILQAVERAAKAGR